MHLIENYALNCGLKISKPSLDSHFFPVSNDDYITIDTSSPKSFGNYPHWQKVIDLLLPFLKKNKIDIIQLGTPNDVNLSDVKRTNGGASVNQVNYLIKHSKIHLCNNSFTQEIASVNNVNCISVIDKERLVDFRWSKKTDFLTNIDNGDINCIYPERIANRCLKILNINKSLNFKTLHIGGKYKDGHEFVESIPDHCVNLKSMNLNNIIVRMDLYYDEGNLQKQLKVGKVSLVTNREIDFSIIVANKNNISEVVYIVEENNDNFDFCYKVKKLGLNLVLISSIPEKDLDCKKLIYMELGNIMPQIQEKDVEVFEKIKNNKTENTYYRTCKYTLSAGKVFFSELDWKKMRNSPEKTNFQKLSLENDIKYNLDSTWIIQVN